MLTRHPGIDVDLRFVPINNPAPKRLTAAQIEHYNRFGFINNVPVFPEQMMKDLCAFGDHPYPELEAKLRDKSLPFQAYHHLIREFYDLVTYPALVECLQDLCGHNVVCHTSMYIDRAPGVTLRLPWHQDSSYNPMDSRCVVVWIAFEDADEDNGCIWCIPGSHKSGQIEFDDAKHTETTYSALATRDPENYGKPTPAPLKRGQVLFFSDLLIHSSMGNRTKDRHRRSLNATYSNTDLKPHLHKGSWAVICAGSDPKGNWLPHHTRPPARGGNDSDSIRM